MRILCCVLIGAIAVVATAPALSQSKIEGAVTAQLRSDPRVRVIIITRPDPERLNGGASLSSASTYVSSALGSSASHVKPIGGLPVVSAEITESAVATLREDPNVVLVTRDIPMPATLVESVPLIGGDKLHKLGFKGTDLAVAVLDSGVQFDHPALAGVIEAEACFSTTSSSAYQVRSLCPNQFDMSSVAGAARQCPVAVEGCEHGTHVAGIVAGRSMQFQNLKFEGVAPAAKIVAIQVFTQFEGPICGGAGKCIRSFTSDQLRALEWVFKNRSQHKIVAVNMSLGGGYHDAPCDNTSALTETIERLRAKGIPTVIAAGNSGFNDGLAEPACISSAVSVAATTKGGELDVSYSNVSKLVHLAAPGTDILSSVTGSTYRKLSGTSMAAPHVAAALAVLRQEFPNDTVLQLENRLITSAPIAVDPRTGTKLPRLELSHTSPAPGPSTAAATGLPATPMTSAVPPTPNQNNNAAGSFIVKTEKSAEDLKATLTETCNGLECSLKQIGKDTYKLDVAPNGKMPPTDRSNFNINASEVHRLLKGSGSTKVFDNRLSNPF